MVSVNIQAIDAALDKRVPRREYLAQLRQTIERCFNEGELHTFCSDLGVDYDSLPGEGTADKARELISYLERRGRIPELVELGKRLRPHASWEYPSPEQLLARIKHAKPPGDTPSTQVEQLTLDGVMATVSSLHDKWPTAGLTAVHDWLNMTKSRLNQVDQISNQLTTRLKRWIDRYQVASKLAQECIYFQSWLSVRLGKNERENWSALAMEINMVFSPIRSDYESYAADIKDTRILAAKEAEILDALARFKEKIDQIEASRSELRKAQEDTRCRRESEQIQNSAEEMVNCSIKLCQYLHSAIKEMVNEMSDPIKALKQL